MNNLVEQMVWEPSAPKWKEPSPQRLATNFSSIEIRAPLLVSRPLSSRLVDCEALPRLLLSSSMCSRALSTSKRSCQERRRAKPSHCPFFFSFLSFSIAVATGDVAGAGPPRHCLAEASRFVTNRKTGVPA